MDGFWNPIDSSGIVGFPHDIPEDVIDNIPEFFDHNHPGAHIVTFTKFIEKWCDPPIHEDVLMQLFVFTLCDERGIDWFRDSPDNTFKTIQDLLHDFLDCLGVVSRRFMMNWLIFLWKHGGRKIFHIWKQSVQIQRLTFHQTPLRNLMKQFRTYSFPRKNHVKQKMNSFGHRRSIGNHGR
jgi:hypothetical protein